ncbi:beta-propeller domain-containing protein, partial [Candidatus Uhrbacteria bacterium]|nr:beta-propeller domain-containing protein [Candidatus Uhrbacteria bacterium]
MTKRTLVLIVLMAAVVTPGAFFVSAKNTKRTLQPPAKIRILIERGTKGPLWYIDPATKKRFALRGTRDALQTLKKLGIGENDKARVARLAAFRKASRVVSKKDLARIPVGTFSMARFASTQEFDAYVEKLAKAQGEKQKQSGLQKSSGISSGLSGMTGNSFGSVLQESAPSASSADKSTSDSITNVQEQGVDEGDIVKAYKGYLVVLRRGRLFTIKLEDEGKPVLTPIARVNAFPEGLSAQGWYDEMLIHANRIVVIGYNYDKGATEIELFSIDDAGKLAYTATYFLDSNDYYSSRNYASRLVDGKLVFYMPYYLFRYGWYGGA